MLMCAICDDEQSEQTALREMVSAWARLRGEPIRIHVYSSAEAFWFDFEGDRPYDLLLLDIQMKQMDGITLAKKIREKTQRVTIIFITAFSDFAAMGYEVSALYYLMKPVETSKLEAALDRANTMLKAEAAVLLLDRDGVSEKVAERDILYVHSSSRETSVVFESRLLKVRLTLSQMENMLGKSSFVRCHRSYLVGLAHIQRITKTEVLLDNGTVLPLARRSYNPVHQAFIRFFRGTN